MYRCVLKRSLPILILQALEVDWINPSTLNIVMENENGILLWLRDTAIGWHEIGDLSVIEANRDAFKEKYTAAYPDAKKGSIATGAGMLYRFCCEAQVGDYVVFPSKINREVNIGVIEGDYVYDPSQNDYVQTRKVKWLKHLPRTSFSQGALYEIGSALTFFTVKNYADEFMAALDKDFKKNFATESEDESVGRISSAAGFD